MLVKSFISKGIVGIYRFVFARRRWWKFNVFLHGLTLRGMGILNYENMEISGEIKFLEAYLRTKQNSVVVDVGANTGEYAALVMEIQPTAVVYALEPHPLTYERLQLFARSKNFKAFHYACDAQIGPAILFDHGDNDGSEHATMFKEAIKESEKVPPTTHIVEAITLDEFIRNNAIHEIDLLKIDVEGNELNVLKGCEAAIKDHKVKVIHFEFNEMCVLGRVFLKDFISTLPDYNFYRMLPSGLIPLTHYQTVLHEIFAFQNIVAIHSMLLKSEYRRLL
jgi:FkbM family methyltransferase